MQILQKVLIMFLNIIHKINLKFLDTTYFLFLNISSEVFYALGRILKTYPILVRVRMTSKCNLSCGFCYLKEGLNKNEPNNLNLNEWKKIIQNTPKFTVFDITGAEPFMAKDFIDFTHLLHLNGNKYSVTTNGTVFNDHQLELFLKNYPTMIMISLDGLEKLHNKIRGNSNAFKRTIDFISKINEFKKTHKSKYPLIKIKTTILDENHHELIDLLDFCKNKLDIDQYSYTLLFQNKARGGMQLYKSLNTLNSESGNSAKYMEPENVFKTIDKVMKNQSRYPFPIIIKPRLGLKQLKNYFLNPSLFNVSYCPQFKNNLSLYHDGSLSPCELGLSLGNIRDFKYRFSDVLKSTAFLQFTKKFKSPNSACQGCCGGKHSSC